jgi:hypothetical protein
MSPIDLFLSVARVLEIGIWGDRIGNCVWLELAVQGCLVAPGSVWFVVIPKSKDRFMERPPMKIVRPSAYMGMAWLSMW